ncbi:MAG: hypothetical protein IAG10_25640 [Planctomycetaceae bacterium]|nr:hypothetical protein [Planctomycetaceae bacterium]
MQTELSTWRPLWDLATVLFVLGIAGGLSSRDRASWWVSQGLLLLSVVIGFAVAQVTHRGVDLFSLGVWVPIAWGLTAFSARRSRVFDH